MLLDLLLPADQRCPLAGLTHADLPAATVPELGTGSLLAAEVPAATDSWTSWIGTASSYATAAHTSSWRDLTKSRRTTSRCFLRHPSSLIVNPLPVVHEDSDGDEPRNP